MDDDGVRDGEGPSALPPTDAAGLARPPSPTLVQILATEHWSLLATRSLTWNESFTRTGMFFTVLSSAVVALALIAQATGFGPDFRTFALVLLPVVLFIGVTTFFRIVDANNEDSRWVLGMNRLRAAYLELHPELARYFITSASDSYVGIGRTFIGEVPQFSVMGFIGHGFVTTPSMVATVASVVAAVLGGTLASQLGGTPTTAVLVGIGVFLATFALLFLYQVHAYVGAMRRHVALFPEETAFDPATRDAIDRIVKSRV